MSTRLMGLSGRAGVLEMVAAGIGGGIVGLATSYRNSRDAARLVDDLDRLDDRALDDIGLTRGDIPRRAASLFDGVGHIGLRRV